MSTENFKTYANTLRSKIKDVARLVQCFKNHPAIKSSGDERYNLPQSDRPEMAANVVLAFRHLEDAAMRLGKAIQAFEGGESCYPEGMGQTVAQPAEEAVPDVKCTHGKISVETFAHLQRMATALGFDLRFNRSQNIFVLEPNGPGTIKHLNLDKVVQTLSDVVVDKCFAASDTQKVTVEAVKAPADSLSWPKGEALRLIPLDVIERAERFGFSIGYRNDVGATKSFHLTHRTDSMRNMEFRGHKAAELLCSTVNNLNELPAFVTAPRAFVEKPFTDESHSA